MSKKAQEEILGFVFVIFILVIIGIFFLLITLRHSSQVMEKENYRINHLLSSIFYFTTECENKNIQELIVDCGKDLTNFDCESNSCEYVNKTIYSILNKTLKGGYSFIVSSDYNEKLIFIKNGECSRKEILSANSILPNGVSVKLLNCQI